MGASISLVAGAALALLVVSFVFAYNGFAGGDGAPVASSSLVLEGQAPAALRSRADAGEPATLLVRETSRASKRPAASAPRSRRSAPAAAKPSFKPGIEQLDPPPAAPPAETPPPPAAPKPAVGDGVRDVGDVVAGTVQSTSQAASEATAQLLGPPVSQAVQDQLDLLTSVLQGATSGLADTLDKTLPPR